jgi:hypothetical protein
MKTMFLKKGFAALMCALAIMSLASCGNDDDVAEPTLKEEIAGVWDVTSYKLNGDEYLGVLVTSATLEFGAYSGSKGQFEEVVTFPDDETFSISGPYEVDEERKEVRMEYEGEIIVAQITITGGDHMVWESIQDEYPLVIEADKR